MDKKLLRWNFIFQYGWVLTNIFNSLLLTPLYIKNIETATLGIWWATGAVLGWVMLVDPGVGEVLQQRIAELRGRGEKSELGRLIGSGYLASAAVLLIAVLLGLGCYFFIGDIINKDINSYKYLSSSLWISVLAVGLTLVSFTMSGINQGLHNSAQVAISSLAANLLFLGVNLGLLLGGYGVLSIAVANLVRAIYLNAHNIISMQRVLRREQVEMFFELSHFRRFIRIFSFTSGSKVITGFTNTLDMVVLARFIAPASITVFEVNRRPIGHFYSLVARHAVALMPLISHAKGKGEKEQILALMNRQFKVYVYAGLFLTLVFCFCYHNLIAAWTGPGQYLGNMAVYLLAAQFLFALLSAFMANISYALGDIKVQSVYNIVRGIVFGIVMVFMAGHFGIIGALITSLVFSATADCLFFWYRVYKMGYLNLSLLKGLGQMSLTLLPAGLLGGWGIAKAVDALLPTDLYFAKLLVGGGLFTVLYASLLLMTDAGLRATIKNLLTKYLQPRLLKMRRI